MPRKLFESPPAGATIAGTLNTMSELTSDSCIVDIVRLDPKLPVPVRAHASDAAVDLYSAETVVLEPGQRELVRTGIAIELPYGTVGLINPRSGLAAHNGLSIVNAPGTVDAGYRGEIKVCLINLDPHNSIRVKRGDRIAQMLVQRVEMFTFNEVDSLDDSDRGEGGYGSTGGHSTLQES